MESDFTGQEGLILNNEFDIEQIYRLIISNPEFNYDSWDGQETIIGYNPHVAQEAVIQISNEHEVQFWLEGLSQVYKDGENFDMRSPEEILKAYENGDLIIMIKRNEFKQIEVLSVLASLEAFGEREIKEILLKLGYKPKYSEKRIKGRVPDTKLREIVMAYTPSKHAGKDYNLQLLRQLALSSDTHYAITATPQLIINACKVGFTPLSEEKTPLVARLLSFGQTKGGGVKHTPNSNIGWIAEYERQLLKNQIHHNNTRQLLEPTSDREEIQRLSPPIIMVQYDNEEYRKYKSREELLDSRYKKIVLQMEANNTPLSREQRKYLRNKIIEDLRENYNKIKISGWIQLLEPFLTDMIYESPRYNEFVHGKKKKRKDKDRTKKQMNELFIQVLREISEDRIREYYN